MSGRWYIISTNKYIEITGGAEIIDNLASDKTTASLSANQGKVLNSKINNIGTTTIIGSNSVDVEIIEYKPMIILLIVSIIVVR